MTSAAPPPLSPDSYPSFMHPAGAAAASAQLPDATLPDQHSGSKSCAAHAKDRVCEYAAQIRFIGLLAGVKGPNDTDQDVIAARASVAHAIRHFIEGDQNEGLNKARATRDEAYKNFYELADLHEVDSYYLIHPNEYYDPLLSPSSLPIIPEVAEAARTYSYAEDSYNTLGQKIGGENWDAWIAGWMQWYEETTADFRNGQVMRGLCKLGVDAAFLLAEEALYFGLAALTAGAAGVMVRVVARVVKTGSSRVRIAVRAHLKGRLDVSGPEVNKNDVPFYKEIDAEKDLTDAERRAVAEENQGLQTQPTPDNQEIPNKGENKQPDAEEQKRKEQAKADRARDEAFEAETTEQLKEEFGGDAVQSKVEGDGYEIDHVVHGIPVETTAGNGKKKLRQLEDNYSKYSNVTPVLYAPKAGLHVRRALEAKGIPVARSFEELVDIIKQRLAQPFRDE